VGVYAAGMTATVVSDLRDAAAALAALGHEARLEMFRVLVRAGDEGVPVHQLQQRLGGMPRSTLAHHLQMLVQAGLVSQRKVGAEVLSRADYAAMRGLVDYLTDECCADVAPVTAPGTCDPPARAPGEAKGGASRNR
jgi:ArsR family transcriptional regulator, arsenate/arsenite/antimonite-responsive transcriptional repressor